MFCVPVVLNFKASEPTAMLFDPEFAQSALSPIATLLAPVVLQQSDKLPTAMLEHPVVLEKSALNPTAMLLFLKLF